MTHLGSGWEKLAAVLQTDPRIDLGKPDILVLHPTQLRLVTDQSHKSNNAESVWLSPVLHNMQMNRQTFNIIKGSQKFIFFESNRDSSVNEIVLNHGYTAENAENYYDYRLHGMRAYWRKIPESLWLRSGDDFPEATRLVNDLYEQ